MRLEISLLQLISQKKSSPILLLLHSFLTKLIKLSGCLDKKPAAQEKKSIFFFLLETKLFKNRKAFTLVPYSAHMKQKIRNSNLITPSLKGNQKRKQVQKRS